MLMMRWLLWISGSSGKKRLGPDAHDALALVTSGGSGKKRLGPDADDALALVDFWDLREKNGWALMLMMPWLL